jgi:phosphatidylglycerol---prolipoprotein diacylglyceryl transferase
LFIENISPVIFTIGPLTVRWYGLMMGISFALGSYYFIKNGIKKDYNEDSLFIVIMAAIISGIIGARALYVLTNLSDFIVNPVEMLRIDRGGLSFHGGLLGGLLSAWFLSERYKVSLGDMLDLAVPGIALGYMLVRIANIFNQEILGRTTLFFPFTQHPTQIYGSLIGLASLLIHNYLARNRHNNPGALFWLFVFYYSLMRGLIEETFRANPLFLLGYVNDFWGVGFFTLTHLITPPLALLAWWIFKRIQKKQL